MEILENYDGKIEITRDDYENSIKQYSQENLEINIYNRKLEFLKDSFKSNNIKYNIFKKGIPHVSR